MNPRNLGEKIKTLPSSPGIYIFFAKGGSASGGKNKPIYIGKALNLKNRVRNYQKTPDVRLQKMIMEATKLDFIRTDSDIEALILESKYIKKFQPPFNIVMRDDKQYGYVGFTEEEYPKIFITHQPYKNKNEKIKNQNWKFNPEFIGPFTDIGALKTTLRLLRKVFPYCTCKQLHNNYCLNYHIGKCPGDCCLKIKNVKIKNKNDNVKLKDYQNNIKAIKEILSGKRESLIKQFEKEMKKLAKEEKFEEALELQNKIEKLKRIFQNAQIIRDSQYEIGESSNSKSLINLQKILNLKKYPTRIECYDIANIQGKYAVGAMVVLTGGKLDKNEYRKFKIYTRSTTNDTAMLREVLMRRFNHPEWSVPDLIIVDGGKGQLNVVKEVLRITNNQLRIMAIALTKNERHIGHKIITETDKEISLSNIPAQDKNLLLQADGEAHRFAISYYRRLHRRSL